MRFGPFTLLQRIGGSGETERWLATLERPGGGTQRVVLKRLGQGRPWDAARADRLACDVEAAARLEHPSLVPLVDVGTVGGIPYAATAELDGHALSDVLHTAGRLPMGVALQISHDVAGLLGALHAQAGQDATRGGPGHWDVRAGNVFLMSDGRVVLFELGTAALDGAPSPLGHGRDGGAGGSRDGRSAVRSLGALLYEMLTGEMPPPDGGPGVAVSGPPADGKAEPGHWVSSVPPSLYLLLGRALAFAPDDRHPSPEAFRDALRAVTGVDASTDVLRAWVGTWAAAHGGPPGSGASRSRLEVDSLAEERPGLRPWQMVLGVLLVVGGWFALQWIAAPYDGSFIKDAAPPLNLVPLEPVAPTKTPAQPEPPTPWAPSEASGASEASGDGLPPPAGAAEAAAP